jgi:hypothetical protein
MADFYGHEISPEFMAAVQALQRLEPAQQIMSLYAAAVWDDERIEDAAANVAARAVMPAAPARRDRLQ